MSKFGLFQECKDSSIYANQFTVFLECVSLLMVFHNEIGLCLLHPVKGILAGFLRGELCFSRL